MTMPSSGTFQYFAIVPDEPWSEGASRWPVQLAEQIDETGNKMHDCRLTGHSPYLEIRDGGRNPNPGISRPSVFRTRLKLVASTRMNSTVSSAAFYVAKDLAGIFKPGDVLHVARTPNAGLGLSLLRGGRLVVAVGAVSHVPLGENIHATTPGDSVRKAESVFRKVDPRFGFREYPLQISIGGQVRLIYRGWLERDNYVCWVEHGYLPGIPGTVECAGIALKGGCGETQASAPAQLLNGGEMEIVQW